MTFKKNGKVITAPNETLAEMFKKNGWTEVEPHNEAMTDDELRAHEAEQLRLKLEAMTDDELRAYALEESINIPPQMSRRETIIDRIIQEIGKITE